MSRKFFLLFPFCVFRELSHVKSRLSTQFLLSRRGDKNFSSQVINFRLVEAKNMSVSFFYLQKVLFIICQFTKQKKKISLREQIALACSLLSPPHKFKLLVPLNEVLLTLFLLLLPFAVLSKYEKKTYLIVEINKQTITCIDSDECSL
jgi:hypothetical protein